MHSWLVNGGLSGLTQAIDDLNNPLWLPKSRVRVVSMPYRLNGAFAMAAGLDTLDATLNLSTITSYWKHILDVPGSTKRGATVYSTHPGMGYAGVDYRCCKSQKLSDFVSLDLLKIANVGFVLSVIPLHGDDIVQVAGPTGEAPIPLGNTKKINQIIPFMDLLLNPLPIRVYSIGKPLPRVFAATSLEKVTYGDDTREFFEVVKKNAINGGAVISDADVVNNLPTIPLSKHPLKVESWIIDGDTVRATLSGGAGYIILNIPYTPFWTAMANGKQKHIYSVNGAQMMAPVSDGTNTISFKYSRPRIRDYILKKF
jgi:hypothetical protein